MPNEFSGERLFIAVWSTGIGYYDRARLDGDRQYAKVAFLDFQTLELSWHAVIESDIAEEITRDATDIQARRGQTYQISGGIGVPGQRVILGG